MSDQYPVKSEPISDDKPDKNESIAVKREPRSQENSISLSTEVASSSRTAMLSDLYTSESTPEVKPQVSLNAETAPVTAKKPTPAGPRTKPTFVPNLGARRSEIKVEAEVVDPNKNKQRRPITPNLSARGGRGRGARNQSNLIQSHSIFEAGPAESTKRFGNEHNSAESYSKVVGISGASSSKSFASSNSNNIVKIEESLLIEDLKEEESTTYIQLKHETKESDVVKNENNTETDYKPEAKNQAVLNNLFNPNEIDKIKEKLLMLQMPENLHLNEMAEGVIGKIKVYKSGKIIMSLNDSILMNVTLSVSGAFLQDAVALDNIENATETCKMANLGHILNKIVCSPKLF